MRKSILYSPTRGVFIGTFGKTNFWSKENPFGFFLAITFNSTPFSNEVLEHHMKGNPDAKLVALKGEATGLATIQECEAAGASWAN
jgi:hypothetical protein